jgi:hypothetical protein
MALVGQQQAFCSIIMNASNHVKDIVSGSETTPFVSLPLIYDPHRINDLDLCKASVMFVEKVRAVDRSFSRQGLRYPQRLHPALGDLETLLPV